MVVNVWIVPALISRKIIVPPASINHFRMVCMLHEISIILQSYCLTDDKSTIAWWFPKWYSNCNLGLVRLSEAIDTRQWIYCCILTKIELASFVIRLTSLLSLVFIVLPRDIILLHINEYHDLYRRNCSRKVFQYLIDVIHQYYSVVVGLNIEQSCITWYWLCKL